MMESKLCVFRSRGILQLSYASDRPHPPRIRGFSEAKHRTSSNERKAAGSNLPTEHFTSRSRFAQDQQRSFEQQSLSLLVRATSIPTMRLPVPTSFGSVVCFPLECHKVDIEGGGTSRASSRCSGSQYSCSWCRRTSKALKRTGCLSTSSLPHCSFEMLSLSPCPILSSSCQPGYVYRLPNFLPGVTSSTTGLGLSSNIHGRPWCLR